MTIRIADTKPVQAFVQAATSYCSLIDESEKYCETDFLNNVYHNLSELISTAIQLPLPKRSRYMPPITDHTRWEKLYKTLNRFLQPAHNIYVEIYDPYSVPPGEPVTQSISDDLADIYTDLIDANNWSLLDPDGKLGVLWNWRYGYETHWGNHAVSAFRALHFLLYSHLRD
jgi:hypothetical protein